MPSFVHNTVDNPIFPNTGKRLTASVDLAVLGGNTQFYQAARRRHLVLAPHGADVVRLARRSSSTSRRSARPTSLPIFERLFLGGEYSVRGFDIRSIGPTVPGSLVVLGGNKSLLFNAEYMISIASQVRLILFYDAGQVRDVGESVRVEGGPDATGVRRRPPLLVDPFATSSLHRSERARARRPRSIGQTSAFKTSTGAELRFFMPVLNVPFRLIFACNPQRAGVLDNNLQPAKDISVPVRGRHDVLERVRVRPCDMPTVADGCATARVGDSAPSSEVRNVDV